MPYQIRFAGAGPALVQVQVARDALLLAEDLAEQGKEDVEITNPEGETLPLRQFAILLRSAEFGRA